MKKIAIISALAFITQLALAQDEGREAKNVRFGLKVTPSIDWYKPEGKIMTGNGAVPKIGGGLIVEFRLAKVASLCTGVQIDLDGGKIKYHNDGIANNNSNTVSYYYNNLDEIVENYNSRPSEVAAGASFDLTHTKYQLNERVYKATYVTIPFCVKLKTNQIGLMTYFGQVGINNSFRWKATANDKVTVLPTTLGLGGASDSKSKIVITKEMNFYTASLYLGAGCEMNLSGSTSLLLGLNYNLGFTSVTKKSSETLEKQTNGPSFTNGGTDYTEEKMPQSVKSNAVVLTIGVLF